MLLIVIAGCDGSVGVRGRVIDAGGAPIAGGEVRLDRPGDAAGFQGATDAEGCFELGGLVAPGQRDYFLTISSAGYQPLDGTVRSTGEYAVLVQLAPQGAAEKSAYALLSNANPTELARCFPNQAVPQLGASES